MANQETSSQPPHLLNGRIRGMTMVLIGATLWGLSGTASQVLFHTDHFRAAWLVSIRMLVSGSVLIAWGLLHKNSTTRALMRHKSSWPRLLAFAVFGLLGVQYTYFKAIADGNAASATLLQYLGPPMIIGYLALSTRRLPKPSALAALSLAVAGTFLLATGGHLHRLEVPTPALAWGLASALCLTFYTLQPLPLIRRYDALAVVGGGMLIGGTVSLALGPVWTLPLGHWSPSAWVLTAFVVVLGTLAAFSFYLASLHYLTPAETGLLATAEPVAAVLAAMLFLHVRLDLFGIVGALCIVFAVVALSRTSMSA